VRQATDYWAFSDQDDVWEPRKLAVATAALERAGSQPALWVSRVRPFSDEAGVRRYLDPVPSNVPTPSLGNALVESTSRKAIQGIRQSVSADGPSRLDARP
jgi:hypothetical protein